MSSIRTVLTLVTAGAALEPLRSSTGAQAPSRANPAAHSQTSPSAPLPTLDRADLEAWLDGFIPYALEQGDIAGAVVLVLKDGEVLLQKGYGYADVAKRTPMDPEGTIVGVGSISKLLTWTAVMQQVEQGRLELDRDITEYLDFEIPATFRKPITLRHLMTHTAGFEERTFKQYRKPRPLREHLTGTPVPDRIYPSGEVAAYSNYGSMLAGYIVERVSGEPFVAYIERHLLEPLGMKHSTFQRPLPGLLRQSMAQSYRVASGEALQPDALDHEEPAGDPSGHLATTANDISRFMLAHLQQGRHGNYQLLAPATTESMHTPTFVALPGAHGMALGFFRADYSDHRIIGHAGDIEGFHADLQLLPEDGVGFFMALNSSGQTRGLLSASNSLRASLFHRFMDRYFPAVPSPEEPTAGTAKEHAQLVRGEYAMSRRATGDFMAALDLLARFTMKLRIEANDDGTIVTPAVLDFERGRPQRWREVGPFVWREVGGRARLNMKVEDGHVRAWLPEDLFSFVMEPVPALKSAALNVGLLGAATVVLILATLLWPVSAIFRRRHTRELKLEGGEARAGRLTRLAAAMGVLFLLSWVALLTGDVLSKEGVDLWIRLVQLIGLLCVAGAAAAVWNAWLTWRGQRSWWAKAGSTVVALALLDLVWFSFAFHLISARLNY